MAAVRFKQMKMLGSTLAETLIAFTVLLLCVTMASMIIVGVERSSGKFDYLEAWITVQNMAGQTSRNHSYTEVEINYDHFNLMRIIKPSDFTSSIFILELKVIDLDNQERVTYKALISTDDVP